MHQRLDVGRKAEVWPARRVDSSLSHSITVLVTQLVEVMSHRSEIMAALTACH